MANNPDLTDDLQKTLTDGRTLTPESVLSNLGLMFGVSILSLLAFTVLRPANKIIYAPKEKYHRGEKCPPKTSPGVFGWIPALIHTNEDQMVDVIGLDAATFLRFLRLCCQLFTGIAVIAGGVLIPVNTLYNLDKRKGKAQDFLTRATLRDVYGDYLWAHIGVAYLITLFLAGLVWYHWNKMISLRRRWFTSPEYINSFYSRTISITNVSSKYRSDEGLTKILGSVKMPYPTTSVKIGRRVGILPALIETHTQAVKDFETVMVKYLKGGKIARARPTIRIGSFWGMGGTETDAIKYYTAKLQAAEHSVKTARQNIDLRKVEPYGFACLASTPQAHSVARTLAGKHPKGTTIENAMNPKDIIWQNLSLTPGAISRKKFIGWIWLCLLCTFSLIPAALVSIVAVMDAITQSGYIPALFNWCSKSPATYALVNGTLAPVLSSIWTYFLPKLMRRIAKGMGAQTSSALDRAVVSRFFAFLVISQLIIFTIWGVIFTTVFDVVSAATDDHKNWRVILTDMEKKLPSQITRAYVQQASFWLKFLPLRGFLVVFDLAQLVNFVWIHFKTKIWSKTPRDIRDWTQPQAFDYAVYYSNLLFVAAVGLLFAPLAPFVTCAAAVVFLLSAVGYKYQLLFVYVSKVESGGRIWNLVINRLLFCALLMHAVFSLTIGMHTNFKSIQFYATLPLPVFIVLFKFALYSQFDRAFRWYTPRTTEEFNSARLHSSRGDNRGNRLEQRFGHPSLHAPLLTPMLHESMIPLLGQVFGQEKTTTRTVELKEYGGEKAEGVVYNGITFVAISKNKLEYDPALYKRDVGERDWDTASLASSMVLTPGSSSIGHPGTPRAMSEYYTHGPSTITSPSSPSASETRRLLSPGPGHRHTQSASGYFEYRPQHPPNMDGRPPSAQSRISSAAFSTSGSMAVNMAPMVTTPHGSQGQWIPNHPQMHSAAASPPMLAQPVARPPSNYSVGRQSNHSAGYGRPPSTHSAGGPSIHYGHSPHPSHGSHSGNPSFSLPAHQQEPSFNPYESSYS